MIQNSDIIKLQEELSSHSMYKKLNTVENLRLFMKYHIFAVWDFMSLLKSLQRQITTMSHPWQESRYSPELVRLINEIVLGEESDLDQNGIPSSHYSLYIKAMKEIGSDTRPIEEFTKYGQTSTNIGPINEMVSYHLGVAESAPIHQVAASFFFGREKLIPNIFKPIVTCLEESGLDCPSLLYYLKRHIELDGDDHGPKALTCLNELTDSQEKIDAAIETSITSLKWRKKLWDFIESELDS